ncbi:hypothetical protein P3T76_010694 [Phytophthora citrophthora]|uniref:Bzip transcription factor n=1 Tax=Phytophthora citrophthora TaxID=4793 RepID=A0AAD9LHE3_9STRA|nr:hypothetical protein P3T76_010694 [Phytophthora citrophthora]
MNTCMVRPSTSQRLRRDNRSLNQALSEQQRLRELRRLRQVRYRKKKDEYTNNLEEQTRNLRKEIEMLERRQRSVSSFTTKESVWSTVIEFFRLFRYGLIAPNTSAQEDFLLNAVTLDVGLEVLIRSWKWFQDVEFELKELKKAGRNSLLASTTTSVMITEMTLRNVFPHLFRDGDREIVEKLLNQRLVMRGSMQFEWDAAYCRVAIVMTQSDLLTPMLRLLGGLETTSYVFEKAFISPDFQWR